MLNQEAQEGKFVKKSAVTRTFWDDEAQAVYEERRAQFDKATESISFTQDFNPAVEAVMRDPRQTIGNRVMAWIKRKSWGNNCLYCVKSPGGEVAYQVDCATDLKIDKRRVSAVIASFVRRGYLEMRGISKTLYPSLSPILADPPKAGTSEYRQFLEELRVTNSADFLEDLEAARTHLLAYESACATVRETKIVLLHLFKKYRASKTNSTRYKEVKTIKTSGNNSLSVSTETGPPPEPPPGPTDTSPPDDGLDALLSEVAQKIRRPNHPVEEPGPQLHRLIRERLQTAPLERLRQRAHQRMKQGDTLGKLIALAGEVADIWRREQRQNEQAERSELLKRIEGWMLIVSDPNESDEIREQCRDMLRAHGVELNE